MNTTGYNHGHTLIKVRQTMAHQSTMDIRMQHAKSYLRLQDACSINSASHKALDEVLAQPYLRVQNLLFNMQSYFVVILNYIYQEKKEDIWLSPMTKANTPTDCHKGKVTTQTTPQKSSITQRLRTDLGWSVWVTMATQLVWLTWFIGPTFPLPATAV